jgi:transposase
VSYTDVQKTSTFIVAKILPHKMCLGKELSEYQKGGIISAKKLRHTNSEISAVVGCSRSSVIRVWESYELKKQPKKRTGRPRILDECAREQLKHSVVENKKTRRQTLSQIRLNFIKDTNKSISIQTIRNELAQEGLHSRIPRLKPLISEKNKEKRLQWAHTYENWTIEDFKQVVWSDESTYTQFRTTGFGRVWREPSEEFSEDCIATTVGKSFGRMFWGCFSWIGLGPLVPLVGRVTGVAHREILANYAIPTVKLHAKKIKKKFLFQEDNAPVHIAKVARSFLTSSNVELLPWPAQSPDITPIENIWSHIEVKIRQRDSQPSNVTQLEQWVKEEWDAVPVDYYRNLIKSMPRRVQAVLEANGGQTKY